MQTLAQDFLTMEEQDKVSQAVHEAEKITSGEIVPMIVSTSHSYPMATLIGAIAFAVPTAIALTSPIGSLLEKGTANMWVFLSLALLFYPIYFVVVRKSLILQSFFLSNDQVKEEVEEGAVNAFFTEKLHKTRDQNGILLYISVFEKKVWVLGDTGINERIEQQEWDQIIIDLTKGLKKDNRSQAICDAVAKVGTVLEKHFPIKEDDTNELHNLIIK